ncbi:uncharacterized protein Triagg1_9167 [Trichoderma aggressivum f. europaeum]|uniref:EGF domain-specific O-linked N-acetylglucosamine transferase n=1 Tax=Trichoderma aggressivum f. europaeum TaxID=173218 RepID=A0AAE1LXB5_9HYPO|nr:hypothetical protein Triagg1_9167 [Trichoderma aggressivum f. europaeum]
MLLLSYRRYIALLIVVFVTCFILLLHDLDHLRRYNLVHLSPSPRVESPPAVLSLPHDYDLVGTSETVWCQERFGTRYLENARDFSASFCTDESTSRFTCFFSHTAADNPPRIDSMCYGHRAVFDESLHRFRLGCDIQSPTSDEMARGVPMPTELSRYWYETGPGFVMNEAVLLDSAVSKGPSQITTILVKREGSSNVWHSLMEIMSLSWSLDVLQIGADTETGNPFLSPEAGPTTQVVLLDNHEDGPFIDMWKLFSKMPIRRIQELNESEPLSDIIIPFAGGSNPLWQGDWEDIVCRDSTLVKTFSSRVLSLYGVATPIKENNKVIVTYIRRANTRKLINEDAHMEALRNEIPNMILNVVDFAAISFAEQLKIVRETDLLVGVHGAGLTHLMFLQPGSAVLEILPEGFQHKGFRNLAQMLGISFFRAHAKMHGDASGNNQWQFDAVELDQQRFVELVDFGVRSLSNNGKKSYDIL